jgi:two-component system sensor histidine kinase/response regulator
MTDSQRSWNSENALARVEGDSTLLRELIQLFLDDYPRTLAELRAAIAQGDTSAAERHAHTLKGAASNFEAGPVVTAGQRLETSAYRNDLANAATQIQQLETALAELRIELEAYLQH